MPNKFTDICTSTAKQIDWMDNEGRVYSIHLTGLADGLQQLLYIKGPGIDKQMILPIDVIAAIHEITK